MSEHESFEGHPEVHPEPDPDCHLCALVALTRVSMRVVELEAENESLRGRIRKVWLDLGMEADEFESVHGKPATVPLAADMIIAALGDGHERFV